MGTYLTSGYDVIARPRANHVAELFIGALHARVVLDDVLSGGATKPRVVSRAELVAAGAIDNATHG